MSDEQSTVAPLAGHNFLDRYLTPIAVLLAGVMISLALVYGNHGQQQGGAQPPAVAVNIKDVKTDNDPYIGSPTAPVTMAFWFDYQCPYCKAFEVGHPQIQTPPAMPELVKNYVETGKLRIVFKDFAFLGNDSLTASEFARGVWEAYPNQFYAWYTEMFKAQDEEGDEGFGDLESIVKMTKEKVPAIDTAKVLALIEKNKDKYDAAIEANKSEGEKMGIQGTPAAIIGTKLISGAQPYASVAPLIDAQIKK